MDLKMTPSSQVAYQFDPMGSGKDPNEGENTMAYLNDNIPDLKKHFILEGVIGAGTFGKVFSARLRKNETKKYALKWIFPVCRPERILTELRFLRDIGGIKNVCGVESALACNGHSIFVLPYFPHDKFTDYLNKLTIADIQDYMKNLMVALSQVHSHGIIHRDLKPSNFLFNYSLKKYLLVDFGLAQDQKDFEIQRKRSSYLQRARLNAELQAMDSSREPLTTKKATINQLVLTRPDHVRQFQITKRPHHELEQSAKTLRSKRLRNDAYGSAAQKLNNQSSVFHTPDTPNTINRSPVKTVDRDENVFKTPTKSTNKKRTSKTAAAIVIPETPQKTVDKVEGDFFARQSVVMAAPTAVVSSTSTTPKSRLQDPSRLKCDCYKRAQVCKICDSKKDLYVARAGTCGFRAPEVLLRTIEQSTALDMWSAGVIFASLLSRRTPFFRNGSDDITALPEIITFLGYKRVAAAAAKMNRTITISKEDAARCKEGSNMKIILNCFRNGTNKLSESENCELIPDSAIDLLNHLLEPYPGKRWTADQALKHPFITTPLVTPEVVLDTPPQSQTTNE